MNAMLVEFVLLHKRLAAFNYWFKLTCLFLHHN